MVTSGPTSSGTTAPRLVSKMRIADFSPAVEAGEPHCSVHLVPEVDRDQHRGERLDRSGLGEAARVDATQTLDAVHQRDRRRRGRGVIRADQDVGREPVSSLASSEAGRW